jgi:hypothetical protein
MKMKPLEYFHIEHCMKFSKPWDKNLGWCVWHSCFDYSYECGKVNEDFLLCKSPLIRALLCLPPMLCGLFTA